VIGQARWILRVVTKHTWDVFVAALRDLLPPFFVLASQPLDHFGMICCDILFLARIFANIIWSCPLSL
jgi:hypothetical protein